MKRIFGFLTVAAFAGMLFAANALAASSGSFSATVDNAQCTINDVTGALSPPSVPVPGGTLFEIGGNDVSVDVSSGAGTTLIITPSLVTGLFTDNKISSSNPSSTQNVGIQVQVNVTGPGTIQIAPSTTGSANASCTAPANGVASCVIYDQRFVQVSSAVF